MDNKKLQNELDELFKELDPEQTAAIKALYSRINGKKPNEILPVIMAFKMPEGRPIDPEKKKRLIGLVLEQLKA